MTLKEIVDNLGFGQECTYKDYSIRLVKAGSFNNYSWPTHYTVEWEYGNYGMRKHSKDFYTFEDVEKFLKARNINPDWFKKGYSPDLFNGL